MPYLENISSASDSDLNGLIHVLLDFNNYSYYVSQFFTFFYSLSSCIWLLYAIGKIHSNLKQKRILEAKRSYGALLDIELDNKILSTKLSLLRFGVFSVFAAFEIFFGLNINLYGMFQGSIHSIPIDIGSNCTLEPDTYLGIFYDLTLVIFLTNLMAVFQSFAFALLIWMFGVSLLNLSHAAFNQIYVKKIIKYISIGILINAVITVGRIIPYTSLFSMIFQSIINQFSLFIALYIAKKIFFPALNSRIKSASQNRCVNGEYRELRRLAQRYKYLVTFFLVTFELAVLKDLIFYNGYIIFESISANACWFSVTYQFPVFQLPTSVIDKLFCISQWLIVIVRVIDIVVYFNLTLINISIRWISSWPFLRQHLMRTNVRYRYKVASKGPRHKRTN